MNKYVVERNIPGVGKMTLSDLQAVGRKSVGVLADLGVDIQWLESFVTADKIYCVYLAPDEDLIREHGRLCGIPVSSVVRISRVIDPTIATATS